MEKITKKCGRFEFEDYQAEIKAILERAMNDFENAKEKHKYYDLLVFDLLHQLEEQNMNAVDTMKLTVKLRDNLRVRRKFKADQQYLHRLARLLNDKPFQKQLKRLLNDSLLQYDDQPYKPRVLKGEETSWK